MSRTVLQVPINPTLRKEAEKEAKKLGFSSLQDIVRLFLKKLANGEIEFDLKEVQHFSKQK